MLSHLRTWRRFRRRERGRAESDYRRRQFRRRMQTSAMLGLVGVALFVGRLLIIAGPPPLLVVVYWVGVLLLVGWVGLLALVDIWATTHHYGRLRHRYLVEEAKLQAELRRIRAARGNGQAKKKERGTEEKSEL